MKDNLPINEEEQFHQSLFVVDGHCDAIMQIADGKGSLLHGSDSMHVNLERFQKGNVSLQVFALFIESKYKPFNSLGRALHLLDCFYNEMETCKDIVRIGKSGKEIKKDLKAGKIVSLLGIEGGEALNGDISVLRVFYRLGVRLIGLTWNQRNQLADGVGESRTNGGLTHFGVEVVTEMNHLGMIIDLSHLAEAGFWDVLEISKDPVLVSHANCKSICNHPRNLTDEQIKALAENGGVLGLSFCPDFLSSSGKASIDDLLEHLDHVVSLVGTKNVGFGSDFDGIDNVSTGLEDPTCYPMITRKLLDRGYTHPEISDIMGGNTLRLIEKVLS